LSRTATAALQHSKESAASMRDRLSVIQSNGYVGERRASGFLGRHFVVHSLSIDRDGADLLVEPFPESVPELRSREQRPRAFGIVQAKFFERGNAVYIDERQAVDEHGPRPHFFLLVHTDDHAGDDVRYFLTAKDLLRLPVGRNGLRRFSITKADDKARFRAKGYEIVQQMTAGMEAFRARSDANARMELHDTARRYFDYRTADLPRDPRAEYHLLNLNLGATSNFTGFCDARVVMARTAGNPIARAIDARWDLLKSAGTWAWGYGGDGPRLVAMSILAHFLGGSRKPTLLEMEAVTSAIIARLAESGDHVVTGARLNAVLSGVRG